MLSKSQISKKITFIRHTKEKAAPPYLMDASHSSHTRRSLPLGIFWSHGPRIANPSSRSDSTVHTPQGPPLGCLTTTPNSRKAPSQSTEHRNGCRR